MIASGSGVVSNVPSGFRTATMIAPVSCRMRRSRIERPATPQELLTSISASWRSGPVDVVTVSMNVVTCGLSTRFARTLPAVAYGSTTRSAPASSSFFSASSSDARATIVRSGCEERADSAM